MMQQMVFALVLGLSLHNPVGLLAQDSSAPQPVVETAPASTVADAALAGSNIWPTMGFP